MNKERDSYDINPEQTPLLNSIPKRNPFTVPDGYFDALPAQIMERIREGKKAAYVAQDKTFWLFRPQWMLAVFAVVVGLCFMLRRDANIASTNYEAIAAALPDSVIEQNLQSNIAYVDINSLEEIAQNTDNLGSLPQQNIGDTTNGQIINYLMNNNIDASDIENEL